MSLFSRAAVRPALSLSFLAFVALVGGCGAAPDGAESQASEVSAMTCPSGCAKATVSATCTRIAGTDVNGLAGQSASLTATSGYAGSNAGVLADQAQFASLGHGGYYQLEWATVLNDGDNVRTVDWFAQDVSNDAASDVTSYLNESASVDPYAGYFQCAYTFGAGVHPYTPTAIVVYGQVTSVRSNPPKGCTSCTPPI